MLIIILSLIIAAAHIYFFVLESLLYTKAKGRKVFGVSIEQAENTKIWALNQGYYNLLLALGIILAIILANISMLIYLLLFVVMVGIVGALTVKPKIFWLQSFPALITLGLICFAPAMR